MFRKPDSAQSSLWQHTRQLLGIASGGVSHREKLLSALGAFIAVAVLCLAAPHLWGEADVLFATSIGASTVLLFAIPHGPLSQPWPVLLGYSVSAVIGVACQQWIPITELAAASAVGGAVLAMHYLRCLHPPGGAAALAAVLGGEHLTALGYDYLLAPILCNAALMVALAVAYNLWLPHRRYPAHLARRPHSDGDTAVQADTRAAPHITHEDVAHALQQMDLYVDVSPEDLCELFELAENHARESADSAVAIEPRAFYSNGETGFRWQIYEVEAIAAAKDEAANDDRVRVTYRIVHGPDCGQCQSLPLVDFRQRVRARVRRSQGHWVRETPAASQPR
ncbi:HPP family protein [Parahaliea mediterranea]|uniref:HPP family protein n=1 Tax=Parahaliea mediterranea TaxID=651086 RepID=A0A939DE88_9GAMM|nr:HPP family protein [Parahaliea mediterranea]MBN7796558.1 HPP family protein [Parahaliea mediterranea]